MQSKQVGKKRARMEITKESDGEGSSVGDNVSESDETDEEDVKNKFRSAAKRQRTNT